MQSIAYGIKCGNQSCDQYAKLVPLKSDPYTKIIHHYLIDLDLRIPLLADISHIGSPVTTGNNSFHHIYYYGEKYSISVSFYDEALNHNYDLLNESNEIYMLQNGIFTTFLYESANSADHPRGPIFEAIIPVDYGHKKRFITYKTRGLSKTKLINLLSQLKENKQ